jgi:hypothetical protein
MFRQRSTSAARHVSLQVGQPFNPFGLFNGLWVPECLARCRWLSGGAKLAWARLARYAGRDGRCFPTMKTLGEEIGVGERQAQKYVAELERHQLVRRISRYVGRAQTSNGFEFLWHELFEEGVNDRSGGRVNDHSGDGANDSSPKENQSQESQFEEKTTNKRISGYASQKPRSAASLPVMCSEDLESEPSKAEAEPDPLADPVSLKGESSTDGWTPEELATVRSRIILFWGRKPKEGFEVSIMLRARGASAAAVCALFDQKFANKKLRVGGRNAPRSQNWFLTVIENEFTTGHLPEPPSPVGPDKQRSDEEILSRGIEAIELPDAHRSIVESAACSICAGAALVRYTDGTVEGCSCRQRVTGSLKRVPPNGAEGCNSSSATRRGSGSKWV